MGVGFVCSQARERKARLAGFSMVAGVDEAGRGSWFGPVFAAAVILSPDKPIRGLKDSKLLKTDRREVLAERICDRSLSWAVGAADVFEIDRINILEASKLAMRRAISMLRPAADYLLLDAVRLQSEVPEESLIHGDARCQCIAAASILAKTSRDKCLREWSEVFPEFGLAKNKGYGTPEHAQALNRFGPTALHRFSFEPVRQSSSVQVWTGYDPKEGAQVQNAGA